MHMVKTQGHMSTCSGDHSLLGDQRSRRYRIQEGYSSPECHLTLMTSSDHQPNMVGRAFFSDAPGRVGQSFRAYAGSQYKFQASAKRWRVPSVLSEHFRIQSAVTTGQLVWKTPTLRHQCDPNDVLSPCQSTEEDRWASGDERTIRQPSYHPLG